MLKEFFSFNVGWAVVMRLPLRINLLQILSTITMLAVIIIKNKKNILIDVCNYKP